MRFLSRLFGRKKCISVVGSGDSLANYFAAPGFVVWAVPRAAVALDAKGWNIDRVIHHDDFKLKDKVVEHDPFYKLRCDDFDQLKAAMLHRWKFPKHTRLYAPRRVEGAEYVHLHLYPSKELVEHFESDFIVDSGSAALALAIFESATDIDIHGFDGLDDSRNGNRRLAFACNHYWIGRAIERGIRVRVNPACNAMNSRQWVVYGYRQRGWPHALLHDLSTTHKEKIRDLEARQHNAEIKLINPEPGMPIELPLLKFSQLDVNLNLGDLGKLDTK